VGKEASEVKLELSREDLMPESAWDDFLTGERIVRTGIGWRFRLSMDLLANLMEQYADEIGKRIRQHERFPAYRQPVECWEDEDD
jgi:hypothetical protein